MSSISVIIPLYNKAAYIERTINSVLNQTFSDYEVIIVDDGSSDGSVDIVLNTFNNSKLRVIQKKNGGPSSARNCGTKEAKSEWVVFLDADDLMLPFCLEYLWTLHIENPQIDYIIGNFFILESSSIRLASNKKNDGIIRNPFKLEAERELTERPGSAMYKKEILLSNLFDEKLRRYEDAECQYRLMRGRNVYVSHIPVMITDRTAFAASAYRNNVDEEFGGNLFFENKSFWEQMCLYLLAIDFKSYYPAKAVELYEREFKRWDLKLAYYYLRLRWRVRQYIDNHSKKIKYDLDDLLTKQDYTAFV